jgi:hypothetical protein
VFARAGYDPLRLGETNYGAVDSRISSGRHRCSNLLNVSSGAVGNNEGALTDDSQEDGHPVLSKVGADDPEQRRPCPHDSGAEAVSEKIVHGMVRKNIWRSFHN